MGLWIFRTGIILDLLTHPKALKSTCWLINVQVVKECEGGTRESDGCVQLKLKGLLLPFSANRGVGEGVGAGHGWDSHCLCQFWLPAHPVLLSWQTQPWQAQAAVHRGASMCSKSS